jgi:hypothetical protein
MKSENKFVLIANIFRGNIHQLKRHNIKVKNINHHETLDSHKNKTVAYSN